MRSNRSLYGSFNNETSFDDEEGLTREVALAAHKRHAVQLQEEWVNILATAVPQLRIIQFGGYFYASEPDKIVPGLSKYVWRADDSTNVFLKEEGTGSGVFERPAQISSFHW